MKASQRLAGMIEWGFKELGDEEAANMLKDAEQLAEDITLLEARPVPEPTKEYEEPPSISQLVGINTKLAKRLRTQQTQLTAAKKRIEELEKYLADCLPYMKQVKWEDDWGLEVGVEMEEWIIETEQALKGEQSNGT